MEFPSLFKFSSQEVAKGIRLGSIPSDTKLNWMMSNAVFSDLQIQDENYLNKLEEMKDSFNLTSVNLNRYSEDIDASVIRSLSNYNLHSLVLGSLHNLAGEFGVENKRNTINIIEVLKSALNETSRRNLVCLSISHGYDFPNDWPERLVELLPNLQSAHLKYLKFNNHSSFVNLCIGLPNLKVLDISRMNLHSLEGISSLQNLEVLKMRDFDFTDGIKELSLLKKLHTLDVSASDYKFHPLEPSFIVPNLVEEEVKIPMLEFLECSQTVITLDEVDYLIDNHPRLKTVVAIKALEIMSTVHRGIEILTLVDNIESTVKAIKYCSTRDRPFLLLKSLEHLTELLKGDENVFNQTELFSAVKIVLYVLSKNDFFETCKRVAIECCTELFRTKYLDILSCVQVRGVAKHLFQICDRMEKEENKILSQGVLIKTCKLELKVHSFFVKKFCTENFDFAGMLPCFSVQYLFSNLTKMSEKHFNAMAREWPSFLQLGLDMYRCRNVSAYKDVLQILMEITQRSSYYCYDLINKMNSVELFKHVIEKNIDPEIKYNILRILLNLAFCTDNSRSDITIERITELVQSTDTDFNDRDEDTGKCWNAENLYLILSILTFKITASDSVTDASSSSLIKSSMDCPLKLCTSDVKIEKIEEVLRSENYVISKIWWSLLTIENLLKNDRRVFIQRYKQRGIKQMVEKLLESERLQQDVGLLEYAKRILELA